MRQIHSIDVPITSGIWGGTYLIADPFGKSLRRIWRFYCIVNLPQNSPLDKHENLEKLVSVYFKTFAEAFLPYGLALDLKMWGGRLPHSNKKRPTITMHLENANRKINWVPDELQAKLIPPIQDIFATFKSNLDATPQPQAG